MVAVPAGAGADARAWARVTILWLPPASLWGSRNRWPFLTKTLCIAVEVQE